MLFTLFDATAGFPHYHVDTTPHLFHIQAELFHIQAERFMLVGTLLSMSSTCAVRAGITACNILSSRFNSDQSPEVSSTVPAFCRTFNVDNQTINKHFTGTFVNTYMSLCARSIQCHPHNIYSDSFYDHIVSFTMLWLIFLVST